MKFCLFICFREKIGEKKEVRLLFEKVSVIGWLTALYGLAKRKNRNDLSEKLQGLFSICYPSCLIGCGFNVINRETKQMQRMQQGTV